MPRNWQDLTSAELVAVADEAAIALLPLAAIEQHGPHLPLSTDLDIGEGLIRHAAALLPEEFPLLLLPPVIPGDSTEHTDFAGTLSLEPETAIRVIVEVGRAVASAGLRRLVLFNTHGGNGPAADIAALRLRRERRLLVVKAHYARFPLPDDLLPADERRHGLHGGLAETAMMLYLKPNAVRTGELPDAHALGRDMARYRRLGPEGEGAFAWMAQDLNPSGVAGNAQLAGPALGRALVEHYAAALAELLEETRQFDLAALR